jgi:hypothetical protein
MTVIPDRGDPRRYLKPRINPHPLRMRVFLLYRPIQMDLHLQGREKEIKMYLIYRDTPVGRAWLVDDTEIHWTFRRSEALEFTHADAKQACKWYEGRKIERFKP